ncbi:MAG: hypothetical protein GY839_17920 [candidate division Zixibacteria bacterium]|nr:hypothetical protein [candidate division Zixibacteria bacterium]
MTGDIHHLQIRASRQVREKIKQLAQTHHRSTADIVRSSLDLGLRLLEKLLEAQSEMVTEYIALLKKDARLGDRSK